MYPGIYVVYTYELNKIFGGKIVTLNGFKVFY